MCFRQSKYFLNLSFRRDESIGRSVGRLVAYCRQCSLWDSTWLENMCTVYLSSGWFLFPSIELSATMCNESGAIVLQYRNDNDISPKMLDNCFAQRLNTVECRAECNGTFVGALYTNDNALYHSPINDFHRFANNFSKILHAICDK